MANQVGYYNHFAENYRNSILACPEPEYWTTDYDKKGSIYQEMKERVMQQQQLVSKYFTKTARILDIGCGFGRQAFWLAKNGYNIKGIDTSNVFIDIAKELFAVHNFIGEFECGVMNADDKEEKFSQVLLLDVLEHVKPIERRMFIERVLQRMESRGILIISVPVVRNRFRSKINNEVVKKITGRFSYFTGRQEHPFTIPGRNEIGLLTRPFFSELEMINTKLTDYYILQKI